MKRLLLLTGLMMMLSGCLGTVVGAAVDVTAAVIKAPFKIGSAVVDAAGSDNKKDSGKKD